MYSNESTKLVPTRYAVCLPLLTFNTKLQHYPDCSDVYAIWEIWISLLFHTAHFKQILCEIWQKRFVPTMTKNNSVHNYKLPLSHLFTVGRVQWTNGSCNIHKTSKQDKSLLQKQREASGFLCTVKMSCSEIQKVVPVYFLKRQLRKL